ncbi:hypothetical protein Tsubulata_046228 [Turnera subulata]|uniref:Peptidase A1 domain-containing protein n=1 Tax=Turnera subulata TaxID=218843 RepID=A0A9Q0FBL9_9ROSI|nr:hypothetical protein Tsubulata_046228 [Turnera subulata]
MRFSLLFVAFMALLSCIAAVQPNGINLAGLVHKSGPITTSAGGPKLIAPPTRYAHEFVFHVNVGIGTFDLVAGGSSFKSYNLAIDSGSDLTWIQCEECKSPGNTCFPQKDPPVSRYPVQILPAPKTATESPVSSTRQWELHQRRSCHRNFHLPDLGWANLWPSRA